MARPRKTGLDYFPFDVDFFDDEKIVAIAGEFGLKGEITAVKLLCAVYRNGYFIEWSDMLRMKMLRSLPGISPELLDQIVARLVKWGFFDKTLFDSVRVLTSKGIQRRFLNSSRKRISYMQEKPYWIVSAPEMRVSAPETTPEREFLPPETPQSKVKKRIKETSTDVEEKKKPSPPPSYQSCTLTLEEEIDTLKNEQIWLNQLQVLHHMDVGELLKRLDEFRLHCASDGKERHDSISDAKQHFNNWLRIVAAKKQEQNVTVRTGKKNQRRGNLLRADEEKTYGGTF